MALQLDSLRAMNINRRIRAIDDNRNKPAELMWTSRIPQNDNVLDSEIMMRYQGRHQIADLIAEDSRATVYGVGKFQLETNLLPKIKMGIKLNESELKALIELGDGRPTAMVGMDEGSLVNRILESLLIGMDWRGEALRYAMLLNGFSYDRLGIKVSNLAWGLPADLMVTPSTPWTTSASCTPVADILGIKEVAMTRYGLNLDRITMSTQALRLLLAATEFQNKAKLFISSPYDIATNFTMNDYGTLKPLAERVLGMKIELNDARYWSTDSTGARASARFHPIEKVILTDTRNDGNMNVWDYANGYVVESMLLNIGTSVIGDLPAAQRGPLTYATVSPTLDPPDLTLWGVRRSFPRKIELASNAWLSVGTLTDSIPVTDPF